MSAAFTRFVGRPSDSEAAPAEPDAYVLARRFGTSVEEHLTQACTRLTAAWEPGFKHWWRVTRVEIPASSLGPEQTIWLGCASWAGGAAVFAGRDSYDAASRALLGELLAMGDA